MRRGNSEAKEATFSNQRRARRKNPLHGEGAASGGKERRRTASPSSMKGAARRWMIMLRGIIAEPPTPASTPVTKYLLPPSVSAASFAQSSLNWSGLKSADGGGSSSAGFCRLPTPNMAPRRAGTQVGTQGDDARQGARQTGKNIQRRRQAHMRGNSMEKRGNAFS